MEKKDTQNILTRDEIKGIVEDLKLRSEIIEKYPYPVEELAKSLGYTSYYFSPSKDTENISGAVNHDKKKIYINENDPIRRQLFTCAHEIGHIILHKNQGNIVDFRSSFVNPVDNIENEADMFAAELLMPEDLFKEKLKEYGSLQIVASFFGVSLQAAMLRNKIISK